MGSGSKEERFRPLETKDAANPYPGLWDAFISSGIYLRRRILMKAGWSKPKQQLSELSERNSTSTRLWKQHLAILRSTIDHITFDNLIVHSKEIFIRSRKKKKNTASRWFQKHEKILGAKGGSWGSKKMETTVYQVNISIFHKSLGLLITSILNNNNNITF